MMDTFTTRTENEEKAMDVIWRAMQEWEEKTCIRFVKRVDQQSYVLFVKARGCV